MVYFYLWYNEKNIKLLIRFRTVISSIDGLNNNDVLHIAKLPNKCQRDVKKKTIYKRNYSYQFILNTRNGIVI